MREEAAIMSRETIEWRERAENAEGALAELLKAGAELLGQEASDRLARLAKQIEAVQAMTSNVVSRRAAVSLAEEIKAVMWWSRRLAARAAMWKDEADATVRYQATLEAAGELATAVAWVLRHAEAVNEYRVVTGVDSLAKLSGAFESYRVTVADQTIGYEEPLDF